MASLLAVHVGPYKTGTTALQAALTDAKSQLQNFGIAYDPYVTPRMSSLPADDDSWTAHHQLAFPFIESPRALMTQDEVKSWFAGVAARPGVTLVSSEALWSMAPSEFLELLALAECNVRLVVVFRCIVETSVSGWHTAVAEGFIGPLEQYVVDVVLGERRDFDYQAHLTPLRKMFSVDVVEYRQEFLLQRLVKALDLPSGAFSNDALSRWKHARPPDWVTSLLRLAHEDPSTTELSAHERVWLTDHVRRLTPWVQPNPDLMARTVEDAAISEPTRLRLQQLCAQNRAAVSEDGLQPKACCG
jgi:hypothetical protein